MYERKMQDIQRVGQMPPILQSCEAWAMSEVQPRIQGDMLLPPLAPISVFEDSPKRRGAQAMRSPRSNHSDGGVQGRGMSQPGSHSNII